MNALFAPGAKRNRLLIIIGLAVLLASPAVFLWASRQQVSDWSDDAKIDAEIMRQEALLLQKSPLPPAFERPKEFSPFGSTFQAQRLRDINTSGTLLTPLGTVDPKNPHALLKNVPEALVYRANEVSRVPKGQLAEGLNYVMLDAGRVAADGLDSVQARVEKDARVIRYLPNNTLLVYVEANRIAALGASADISFAHPLHPAYKVALDTGVRPLMLAKRASDPNLTLEVYGIPGRDAAALKSAIQKVEGVRSVVDFGADGLGYQVTAHFSAIPKLAHLKDVLHIKETYEFLLSNAKNVPTVQIGSWEDSLGLRPFDMAGVDGGGIDTNNDGQRINDGTDTVPPQIVGVLDNGISYDTPSFSQSSTLPTDPGTGHPIGAAHRKVHAVINIADANLSSCDGVLSGAGTHGNVVASTIAANGSDLGAFAVKSGLGFVGASRNENLDGVARGARIMMEDAADPSQCTGTLANSLIERGGNVTPGRLIDDMDKLICPKAGSASTLCTGVTGGAGEVHLAALPFGAPDNFSNVRFPKDPNVLTNYYPQESADLDTFLYNNRDFMIVSPVGNSGGLLGGARLQLVTPEIPDLFNGTALDDDPNNPHPIQIQSPSSAKNIISVGSHRADNVTFFGTADTEQRNDDYSGRGPASPQSLRTAPILMAPASDLLGGTPVIGETAAFRSKDNDNQAPVEAQLDQGNFGTSMAAGYVTGAAAVVRDYFAQGFFPTGVRSTADRVPNVSGALVKASLVASARFLSRFSTLGQDPATPSEGNLRRTRSMNVGTISGVPVNILGNNEQGYGRVILTQVLPLSNWSRNFILEPNNTLIEHPAAALLAWDDIATHEPRINNAAAPCAAGANCSQIQHLIRVLSPETTTADPNHPGSIELKNTEVRIGLAWPDLPSPATTGGPLVNDLDLILEGPGPDNCLGGVAGETKPDGSACPGSPAADNVFFDGNNYDGGHQSGGTTLASLQQPWSLGRVGQATEVHDTRNPQEAIHLSAALGSTPLYAGNYRLTVRRGTTGVCSNDATRICANNSMCVSPGTCTPNRAISGIAAVSEDANNNRRLDDTCVGGTSAGAACYRDSDCAGGGTCTGGEDTNHNGLLDLDGQSYALVVAGPVYLAEAAPTFGPTSYPQSNVSFTSIRYSCASSAVLNVFDSTPGADAARSQASTTFTVTNKAGQVLDTETNISFTGGTTVGSTTSSGVPLRINSPAAVSNDGVLEVDTGQFIVATYAPAGQRAVAARATVQCNPDLVNVGFGIDNNNAIGPQFQIAGGCDQDEFLDAGETVTYGVALTNESRTDDYLNVMATLTASGPGAAAVKVLDSPKPMGRIPANSATGVFFHVKVVDAASLATLVPSLGNRKVTMSLVLDATNRGQRLSRQSYSFQHAINADRQTFHYSTDFPNGGFEVRDFNRNLVIDQPGTVDPFRQIILPDEIVSYQSMFVPGTAANEVSNTLGEDLNKNGTLDAGEDIVPDGVIDRGILASSAPSANDFIPWHFDANNADPNVNRGGWVGIRHPQSSPANVVNEVWEYQAGGLCGFQTTGGAGRFGIWHTGDGNPLTPAVNASACDNYVVPRDSTTPNRAEIYMDVLHSPVIAKVHQVTNTAQFALGLPFTVEFQRFAANFNMQTFDAYAGGGINIDSNLDDDNDNTLLGQEMDIYYTRRFGGWAYGTFRFAGQQFEQPNPGIDPKSYSPYQRTFGPYLNPNGSAQLDGDESGFTGKTQNSNPDSASPIPLAKADYLKFPLPGLTVGVPGVCTFGTFPPAPPLPPLKPCQTNGDCGAGGVCNLEVKTVAGPVRNFESTLVGYEGGFAVPENGISSPETYTSPSAFVPGQPGNRWGIGISFFSIENTSGTGDYGFAVDDVVFEWNESTPLDETQFTSPTHTPACERFNAIHSGQGFPAGGQCATITADRTNLYECDSALQITVVDPKKPAAASVQVSVVTESDSIPFVTPTFSVLKPSGKLFTLPAVPGSPGLFKGNVTVSSQANNAANVFADPATNATFTIYYVDSGCDANGDSVIAQDFDNLDGDGVPDNTDNCQFVYNVTQADVDGDHVGDDCDNCVLVYNPSQADANADGVGDACEFDDVDGDGVSNATDNCPDVYNPGQEVPPNGHQGLACNGNGDLDNDGTPDKTDNCVLAYNPGQTNTDLDLLGDACDGDCAGATPIRICNNASLVTCTLNSQCASGVCLSGVCNCTSDSQCQTPAGGVCQTSVRHTGICSSVNDDADADLVEDAVDDCPDVYNPPIIANTLRQLDSDRNGVGDACDKLGNFDTNRDGVPDDLPFFAGTISCKIIPLAKFTLLATSYKDAAPGDQDVFPDPGELGRVRITLKNAGPALTGAIFHLSSDDGSVSCVNSPNVLFGNIAANQTFTLSDFDPNLPINTATPGFFFTTSPSTISVPGQPPAKVNLCLNVTADQTQGMAIPLCFSMLADLNTPPGGQVFTAGPDGSVGTPDDGTMFESFDTDRDGDTLFTVNDTFRDQNGSATAGAFCSNAPGTACTSDVVCPAGGFCLRGGHGSYWKASQSGLPGTIAGVACGGFNSFDQGNPGCRLNPAFPFDWHIHCKNGVTTCPNTESLVNGGILGCLGAAGSCFDTPTDDEHAVSGNNSLHMGVHFDSGSAQAGDSYHLRTLQAFAAPPINLALFPRPGDLELNFYHIVDLLTGGDGLGVSGKNVAWDSAEVQIRVDNDPDPNIDSWGFWDRLTPFQNVYDHAAGAWSSFTPLGTYCNFTPTDTGNAPPAPRGVHETMCYPSRVWGVCGEAWPGAADFCTQGTPKNDVLNSRGLWVQSRFNLASFFGQRVQIRWVGQTWDYDAVTDDYFHLGARFTTQLVDDGWWVDDITVTGTLQTQFTPTPDTKTPPTVNCPVPAGTGGCNANLAGTDHGTSPVIFATDVNSNVIAAGNTGSVVTAIAISGQPIRVSGFGSTIPGGCTDGVAQYQFFKNGVLAQDWSSESYYPDSPESDALYTMHVRCSSDTANRCSISLASCATNADCPAGTGVCQPFNCTSSSPSVNVPVFRGDSSDVILTLTHSPAGAAGTTTLHWLSRPQGSPLAGYSVLTGTTLSLALTGWTGLVSPCHIDQALPIGTDIPVVDPNAAPSVGGVRYYLVGHDHPTAGALSSLGNSRTGTCSVSAVACTRNTQCVSGSTDVCANDDAHAVIGVRIAPVSCP